MTLSTLVLGTALDPGGLLAWLVGGLLAGFHIMDPRIRFMHTFDDGEHVDEGDQNPLGHTYCVLKPSND